MIIPPFLDVSFRDYFKTQKFIGGWQIGNIDGGLVFRSALLNAFINGESQDFNRFYVNFTRVEILDLFSFNSKNQLNFPYVGVKPFMGIATHIIGNDIEKNLDTNITRFETYMFTRAQSDPLYLKLAVEYVATIKFNPVFQVYTKDLGRLFDSLNPSKDYKSYPFPKSDSVPYFAVKNITSGIPGRGTWDDVVTLFARIRWNSPQLWFTAFYSKNSYSLPALGKDIILTVNLGSSVSYSRNDTISMFSAMKFRHNIPGGSELRMNPTRGSLFLSERNNGYQRIKADKYAIE